MPYAVLPGLWWHGSVYGGEPRSNSASAQSLNQTSRQRICCVFKAPKAGTISRVIFGVSLATAVVDVRLSFQDLTSGNPDGTEDQFRDHLAADFTINTVFRSGILSHDGTDGGTQRVVTHGQSLAVVLRWTGSPGATAQLQWTGPEGTPTPAQNQCYQGNYNGTSWSKQVLTPRIALEYADGTVEAISGWFFPEAQVVTPNVSSATTPDEVGVRFQLGFTGKLSQAMLWPGSVGGLFDVVLYDEADVVLATFSGANSGTAMIEVHDADSPIAAHFDDVVLDKDAVYRLVLKATSTGVETFGYYTVDAVALSAFPGLSRYYWTERTDGGAWTDRTTRMPMFLLGFSELLVNEVSG
ncbi:MAG: hypothetical protein AB7S57_19540 [Acetobacteraceae bacterium]